MLLLPLLSNAMSQFDIHDHWSELPQTLVCDEIYGEIIMDEDCKAPISQLKQESSDDSQDNSFSTNKTYTNERARMKKVHSMKIRLWANASPKDKNWTCIKCSAIRSNRDTYAIMSHMSSVHNICCLCEEPHEFKNRESLLEHYLKLYPKTFLIKKIGGHTWRHNRRDENLFIATTTPLNAVNSDNVLRDNLNESKKNYNTQIILWASQENWICPECFQSRNKTPYQIIHHMAVMHEKCYQCDNEQTFNTRQELYNHCWEYHPNTSITKIIRPNKKKKA